MNPRISCSKIIRAQAKSDVHRLGGRKLGAVLVGAKMPGRAVGYQVGRQADKQKEWDTRRSHAVAIRRV